MLLWSEHILDNLRLWENQTIKPLLGLKKQSTLKRTEVSAISQTIVQGMLEQKGLQGKNLMSFLYIHAIKKL